MFEFQIVFYLVKCVLLMSQLNTVGSIFDCEHAFLVIKTKKAFE